jgi:MFS family permease
MAEALLQLYFGITQLFSDWMGEKLGIKDPKPWWLKVLLVVVSLIVGMIFTAVSFAALFLVFAVLSGIAVGIYRAMGN